MILSELEPGDCFYGTSRMMHIILDDVNDIVYAQRSDGLSYLYPGDMEVTQIDENTFSECEKHWEKVSLHRVYPEPKAIVCLQKI